MTSGPVLCPFRRLTGLPCPACGLTRSWNAAGHLDLGGALHEHPLGPASLVAAGLALAHDADGRWLEARIRRIPPAATAAGLALWLGWWLIRVRRAALERGDPPH